MNPSTRTTIGGDVPRPFLLVRHHDVSGVSGTGYVAEGVEWTDGSASVRWFGDHTCTAFFPNGVDAIRAVHGHGHATEIVFRHPTPADRTSQWTITVNIDTSCGHDVSPSPRRPPGTHVNTYRTGS